MKDTAKKTQQLKKIKYFVSSEVVKFSIKWETKELQKFVTQSNYTLFT